MFRILGCPSGHVMVTAAVWFVMMSALANHIQSRGHNPANSVTDSERFMGRLPWLFLVVLTTGISVSRVYIATHFPHQVLLGAVIGNYTVLLSIYNRVELGVPETSGPSYSDQHALVIHA